MLLPYTLLKPRLVHLLVLVASTTLLLAILYLSASTSSSSVAYLPILNPHTSSPSSTDVAVDSTPTQPSITNTDPKLITALAPVDSNAYLLYATSNTHLCATLILAQSIRRLGSPYPIHLLLSPEITNFTLQLAKPEFERLNVMIHANLQPPEIKPAHIAYYESVLLKLLAFKAHHLIPGLKRGIILDADSMIQHSLDHLFLLPEVDVAAPAAYWLKDQTSGHEKSLVGFTSALMVVRTNDAIWSMVSDGISSMSEGEYDMDVIERIFGRGLGRSITLPGWYCTLNSHWEGWDLPAWWGKGGGRVHRPKPMVTEGKVGEQEGRWVDWAGKAAEEEAVRKWEMEETEWKGEWKEESELVKMAEWAPVVHFTAVGKPWGVEIDGEGKLWQVSGGREAGRVEKKGVHEVLVEQFKRWQMEAEGVCAGFWERDDMNKGERLEMAAKVDESLKLGNGGQQEKEEAVKLEVELKDNEPGKDEMEEEEKIAVIAMAAGGGEVGKRRRRR